MGAPLRKFAAANDVRPAAGYLPMPPRVLPYVRLAPTPPPRQHFSWVEALAALFLAATLFLLGAVAGTVFWFTYDTAPPPNPVASPPIVAARPASPIAPQPEPQAAPPDIVLPAAEPAPAAAPAGDVSGMQLIIRDRDAGDAEALLASAAAQLETGKAETALVFYERVLIGEPENRAALEGKAEALGRIAAKPESLPVTLTALRKLALMVSDDAAIQANYARALAQRGDAGQAIVYFNRALQLAPGDGALRFDLAVLYDRAGHAPEALILYRQVLELAGDGASPFAPETLEAVRQRATYLETLPAAQKQPDSQQ